jgi:uncharacterized membrane protein YgdD (TMEM256/DUF423 family)
MPKFFLIAGSLLGASGVGLGAFGAHALKASLEAAGRFDTFETAVRYQFYHALALVAVGILMNQYPEAARTLGWSGWAFLLGTLVFSGSLYLICFTGIRAFGAVAPIGGLGMVLGWALLAWGISRV